jgi:plasmid stabilization system protein ParE
MNVVWSRKAQRLLEKVHQFYIELYGENKAEIIKANIVDAPDILVNNPYSGKIEERFLSETDPKIIRSVIQHHCKILYEVIENQDIVLIVSVFDTRQNPNKMLE